MGHSTFELEGSLSIETNRKMKTLALLVSLASCYTGKKAIGPKGRAECTDEERAANGGDCIWRVNGLAVDGIDKDKLADVSGVLREQKYNIFAWGHDLDSSEPWWSPNTGFRQKIVDASITAADDYCDQVGCEKCIDGKNVQNMCHLSEPAWTAIYRQFQTKHFKQCCVGGDSGVSDFDGTATGGFYKFCCLRCYEEEGTECSKIDYGRQENPFDFPTLLAIWEDTDNSMDVQFRRSVSGTAAPTTTTAAGRVANVTEDANLTDSSATAVTSAMSLLTSLFLL